jgi:AraC family transcriptional regulator
LGVATGYSVMRYLRARRIESRKAFLVVGLRRLYGQEANSQIPAQWQEFTSYIGTISGQIDENTYGVGYNSDDEGRIDYLCGVEVADFANLPSKLDGVRLPQQRYAVFTHRDHVSTINHTWNIIWGQWLPQSEYTAVDAPFFECYGENFNPLSGMDGCDLWVPVQ